ncbi:hypothetical protein Cob_v003671 [Colletotrichum orbiculare MAFF 240422]|uniref:Uncharacterized protein n=1 Tax=Colletotrichum orbiculare (strain 104-T / ATCC 96160 / CBS 514.97 / LARS 414 / MAFF 240422) TaxID=1213857 RepID=A0A484G089_COLOR|nr:hypothetical protein Cob_v003671 [Colletotrichum orbiculare MAFF 240422]
MYCPCALLSTSLGTRSLSFAQVESHGSAAPLTSSIWLSVVSKPSIGQSLRHGCEFRRREASCILQLVESSRELVDELYAGDNVV